MFELKIFHKKKFIVTLNSSGIQPHVRDLAWRSSEEIVAFTAIMYIYRACSTKIF